VGYPIFSLLVVGYVLQKDMTGAVTPILEIAKGTARWQCIALPISVSIKQQSISLFIRSS